MDTATLAHQPASPSRRERPKPGPGRGADWNFARCYRNIETGTAALGPATLTSLAAALGVKIPT